MFRKIYKKINNYTKDNILIRPVGLIDEEVSIGDWNEYYSDLKMVYNNYYQCDYNISYIMKEDNYTIGYFIVADMLNDETTKFSSKYDRKMILIDFAIDKKNSSRYAKCLFDYLIYLAKNRYCKVIEIKKVDEFNYFYDFLKKKYNVFEDENSYYINIIDFKKMSYENNLQIFKDDLISIENLYFLYGLKFKIYRNNCIYKNKDLFININRKTCLINIFVNGKIIHNINIVYSNETRNFIYYLCLKEHNILDINLFYNNNDLVGNFKDTLLMFKNPLKIINDYKLLNEIYFLGYKNINFYYTRFDYHHLDFIDENINIDIYNFLLPKAKFLDLTDFSLVEKRNKMKLSDEFNEKLFDLKEFKFSFQAKNNLYINIEFNEKIEIISNVYNNDKINFSKEEIINELKKLAFNNWKTNYNENYFDKEFNWNIKLIFSNNVLEYNGINSFPNTWIIFIEFIKKYFDLNLEAEI